MSRRFATSTWCLRLPLGLCLWVSLAAGAGAVGCSTGKGASLRSLPTTLSDDTTRLLTGCDVENDDDALTFSCPDGVKVGTMRTVVGLVPVYEVIANDLGNNLEAPPRWQERTLPLDAGSVVVREAAFVNADDEVKGTFLASGAPEGHEQQEVWCHGPPGAGPRCEAIITALLQGMTSSSTTTAPSRVATSRLMGRPLSLPTSCGVLSQDERHGRYTCGALSMSWHVAATMDDAVAEAEALLQSIPSEVTPTPLPCMLGHEASVCRATTQVIVSTAYVDGQAVLASCVQSAGADVRGAKACRILLNGSWPEASPSP